MASAKSEHIGPSKRAWVLAFFLYGIILAASPFNAFSRSFGLMAGAGVVNFAGLGASSPSTSWSGGFAYSFSEPMTVELNAGISHPTRSYDIPGGSQSLNLNGWWVEALVVRNLLMIGDIIEVGAHSGIGVTRISHDPFMVNTGALGSIIIPGAADAHTHALAGVRLTGALFSGVAAQLSSDLRLFDPFTSPKTGYSISGGLLIALL